MWECGETMDSLWQKMGDGHRSTRKSHLTQSMSQLTEQTGFLIVFRTSVPSWLSVTGREHWRWISRAIFDLVAPDCVWQLEMRRPTSSQEDVANIFFFFFLLGLLGLFSPVKTPVTQTKMDDMSAVSCILQKWPYPTLITTSLWLSIHVEPMMLETERAMHHRLKAKYL